jgi:hypothetical protein
MYVYLVIARYGPLRAAIDFHGVDKTLKGD